MQDRIEKIHEVGGKFIFSHVANQIFEQNLFIVDSKASELIGSGLLYFYTTGLGRMEDIEKAISLLAMSYQSKISNVVPK